MEDVGTSDTHHGQCYRHPRSIRAIAGQIDAIVGVGLRTVFATEAMQAERRRRRLLEYIRRGESAGKKANHPELAVSSSAWIRKIRDEGKTPALDFLERAALAGDSFFTSAMNVVELYGGIRPGERLAVCSPLTAPRCDVFPSAHYSYQCHVR